jgi:hypothetical protein
MRVQFGRLRGDLVVSDGEEAWTLTRAVWEQIDATTAFLKSEWLSPAQAGRAFRDELPALPPRAFGGRSPSPEIASAATTAPNPAFARGTRLKI